MSEIDSFHRRQVLRKRSFARWLVALSGLLVAFKGLYTFFPGSSLPISAAFVIFILRDEHNPENSIYDKRFWGLSGIMWGFVIAGILPLLCAIWLIVGYILWPHLEKVKSSHPNFLLVSACIVTGLVVSFVLGFTLKDHWNIPISIWDMPGPGILYGLMANAWLSRIRLSSSQHGSPK